MLLWRQENAGRPELVNTCDTELLRVPAQPNETRDYSYGNHELLGRPLWQIAEATCASPGNFSRSQIGEAHYMDGSIAYANPTRMALQKTLQGHQSGLPVLVISIGTGEPPTSLSWSIGTTKRVPLSTRSILSNLSPITSIQAKYQSDLAYNAEEEHMRTMETLRYRQRDQGKNTKYFRFNPPVRTSDGRWEWGKSGEGYENRKSTHTLVNAYLAQPEVNSALMECARYLVDIRRDRQATVRWERFADLEIYYQCPDCRRLYFEDRSKLEIHGFEKHDFVSKIEMVHYGENSDDSVGGTKRYQWTCNRPHAETNSIFCFDTEDDFVCHLRESHGLQNPRIVSPRELHAWLDTGRKRTR